MTRAASIHYVTSPVNSSLHYIISDPAIKDPQKLGISRTKMVAIGHSPDPFSHPNIKEKSSLATPDYVVTTLAMAFLLSCPAGFSFPVHFLHHSKRHYKLF